MQRIVIKNFGAVKEADIELKKITVLIGEQASGKSTIAKLVYYFKTLKEDFFRELLEESLEKRSISYFSHICKEKFYNLFGSTINLPQFKIRYYFTENKYISLSSNENKVLIVDFSAEMQNKIIGYSNTGINKMQEKINNFSYEKILIDKEKESLIEYLIDFLNNLFENNQIDFLYIIAGRSATVSYSELFEKYLFAEVQYKIR